MDAFDAAFADAETGPHGVPVWVDDRRAEMDAEIVRHLRRAAVLLDVRGRTVYAAECRALARDLARDGAPER